MTDTPETDNLARGNHVVPTEFAQQLERQRDSLARSGFTLDWNSCLHPHTMRTVLATDGENIYVATYTKEDGWQDAYSLEEIDFYITHWCEIPELPQA